MIETQEFATLPPVAAKVLQLLEDENIDIRDLVQIIETDASLTLKLLRVANSPLYATRQDVTSIHQAIITLGLNRLTNIVLGVSIFSRFLMNAQKSTSKIMDKFWWHSSCTGIIAKALCKKLNKNFKEMEFIGGLLHDIGKLAMLQFDPAKFLQVINLTTEKGMMDVEAETEVFGVNHLQVGEHIAKLWKLPNELAGIVGYHNNPEEIESCQAIISVIRFADILCELWGADIYEGFTAVKLAETEPWKVLCKLYPELADLDIEVFTFELEEEYKTANQFLNIIKSDAA